LAAAFVVTYQSTFDWHPPLLFDLAIVFLAGFDLDFDFVEFGCRIASFDYWFLFGPVVAFAGSILGFLLLDFWFQSVLFSFIGSFYAYFVEFSVRSGFAYRIACLPVASCVIVSTSVAAPKGSLQPELCSP